MGLESSLAGRGEERGGEGGDLVWYNRAEHGSVSESVFIQLLEMFCVLCSEHRSCVPGISSFS